MGVRSRGVPYAAVAHSAIRRDLLRWYERNKRALPWRANRQVYRVWVAEVMLQQTRIAVVEPAYRRFVRAFPTMSKLAAATEEEVLSLWSGLGYYSRARSLHRAAQQLMRQGGKFPRDLEQALELPGVGRYTAAAVLSIAYNEPHAAVDGNVIRVLSRLRCLALPDSRGEPHQSLATALLDRARPGEWNQAVMELGETICVRVGPGCDRCPLKKHCEASQAGVVERHPPVKKRRATEKIKARMLLLRDRRGRVLLERGVFPYLPEMWLPIFDEREGERDGERETERGRKPGGVKAVIRHAITHRVFEISVVVRTASESAMHKRCGGTVERRVFTPSDLKTIGRSSLLQKALAVK